MEAKNITKSDEKATANQPIQQAKTNEQPNASTELTGNATEGQKGTNETAQKIDEKATATATKGKAVIVEYVGGSIWQDSEKKLWSKIGNGAGIKPQRQYSAEEYEKREDLKFMVGYGEMKATFVE